jgi:uncharacterized protein YndB with AHSA1/START domain
VRPFGALAAAIALVALATGARAAVVQVNAGGFALRHEATVSAPAVKVYDTLVQPGSWWDSEHTYSGDANNMSIDARAGGCFCERLKDGGSIEHMRVVYAQPGRALRMAGGLGPLQAAGVAGSMTWRFTPIEGGTKLEMSYAVGGFVEGGFDKMSALVDTVLGEQFQRLKLYVETGKPTAK